MITAIADSGGALRNPVGIDLDAVDTWKREHGGIERFPGAEPMARDDIVGVDVDVFVPAARPDVVRRDNVDRVKAHVVLSGANIPMTTEAEAVLHARRSF